MEDDIDIDGMADVYGDLNDFEKRLKKGPNAMNYEENSSDDEKVIDRKNPLALAEEKIRMLMDRLFKSEKELNDMKETYESIIGSSESLKDKKIIDLAKKNRALQLQAESLKTKAAKAAEFALQLKKDQDKSNEDKSGNSKSNDQINSTTNQINNLSIDGEKKLKEMEKKITKMRNENQEQKILIEKATRILEREIGEIVDINELSKEESQWKGRAQKIDILKTQVRKLKSQLGIGPGNFNGENSMMTDGGQSITSEVSAFSGRVTNVEKKITQIGEKKKEEIDKLKYQIDELKEELKEVKTKYQATVARKDTLEKQLKTSKTEFGMKIKMLLDKAENDDKLIAMLKQEVARLENTKGIKSQLKSPDAANQLYLNDISKFKQEISILQNQVKCYEIELEQKNSKINQLMTNCIGAPDERYEEKDLMIVDLEEKCEKQERELFKLKQEMKDSGESRFPKKNKDDQERLIQDLTKQNAMLRRKLDDLQIKLNKIN